MIRVGLLGAARIAPLAIIAPIANRSDCEIVAVGCRSRKKGLQFTADNLLTVDVMDYAEVCKHPDIDAVYIALPPSEHEHWACLAMEHGKAVLCEKPVAMGAKDARSMVDMSRHTGCYFMEAFHYFYHPAFQSHQVEMRDLFKREKEFNFEAVLTASIPKTPNQLRYKAELGGGALMDLGCYALHILRQIFGEMDVLSVDADIEDGVDVALTAQFSAARGRGRLHCNMREGAKREDYVRAENEAGAKMSFTSFVAPYRGYTYSLTSPKQSIHRCKPASALTTYDYQLNHFLEVIKGGQPLLPLSDVIAQAETIEAIYKKVGLR